MLSRRFRRCALALSEAIALGFILGSVMGVSLLLFIRLSGLFPLDSSQCDRSGCQVPYTGPFEASFGHSLGVL